MPNHHSGDLPLTIGISGLSRVRTELFELFVIPTLAPHPVQMHGQLSRHGYLGDLPATSHRKMEKPVAPLRVTAYRDLRCLYQQKPKQRVALLADVPQSPIAAGFLRRHQPHIAGDLFAAVKTLCISDHQLESQRRQRPRALPSQPEALR
jgi:hypothetical protein